MAKVVHLNRAHTLIQGDERMEKVIKRGETTIILIIPQNTPPEKREQVERDLHNACWAIVDELIEKGEAV